MKRKKISEFKGLGMFRKGVKTLMETDFTWLKKKDKTVYKSRLPGYPTVQECKQLDIRIMGDLEWGFEQGWCRCTDLSEGPPDLKEQETSAV